MSEDVEKKEPVSNEEMPESPEEMEAAIEEVEAEFGEQLDDLEQNLDGFDFKALMEKDFGRTYEAFKQAKKDIALAAQTALAGAGGLIAIGSLDMAATGVNYEQVQGFFEGGLAAGGVAAAVYVIGHAVNKMKGWSARAN